jgi:hypothetical protein
MCVYVPTHTSLCLPLNSHARVDVYHAPPIREVASIIARAKELKYHERAIQCLEVQIGRFIYKTELINRRRQLVAISANMRHFEEMSEIVLLFQKRHKDYIMVNITHK